MQKLTLRRLHDLFTCLRLVLCPDQHQGEAGWQQEDYAVGLLDSDLLLKQGPCCEGMHAKAIPVATFVLTLQRC